VSAPTEPAVASATAEAAVTSAATAERPATIAVTVTTAEARYR